MHDFIDDLAGTGGTITSVRIRAWIDMQRVPSSPPSDYESFAESA